MEDLQKVIYYVQIDKELDLLDFEAVKSWFSINKPKIIIIAAAKVGGFLQIQQNLTILYLKI